MPSHSHGAQWGVVLEGEIELVTGGVSHTFTRGDSYFIPEGVEHSARIRKGYADVTFFDEPDRFKVK
jgi:quercetin dioxygenase-like cupin family protein